MPVIRQGNPNRILVHHSAVAPGADNLSDLRKRLASYEITHSKKSWAKETKTGGEYGYYYLAYHIAVAKDGHEIRTQDDKYILYHAGDNARGKDSFNLHGIAVLLDGNYETEIPTPHQKEALARIIARFERKYKVNVIVRGHKQTSLTPTACPGVNIGTHENGFLKEAIARANEIIKNGETDEPLKEEIPPEPITCEAEREEIRNLQSQLKDSQILQQQTAASLSEIAAQLADKTKELEKSQSSLEVANKTIAEKEETIRKLERKITERDNRIAELEKERTDYRSLYEKTLERDVTKISYGKIVLAILNREQARLKSFLAKLLKRTAQRG